MSLDRKIQDLIVSLNPEKKTSVKVLCFLKGNKKLSYHYGPSYLYYDLSSLTKIIFTHSSFMNVSKKVQTSDFLSSFLNLKTGLKIKDLLSHQTNLSPTFKDLSFLKNKKNKKEVIFNFFKNTSLRKKTEVCYSDLNFLLLSFVLEKLYEKDLKEIWDELRKKWDLNLFFNPDGKKKSLCAPTYRDFGKDQKLLKGEVQDEMCYLLGGLSTHAGLFSSIDDLGKWSLKMRNSVLNTHPFLIPKSVFKRWTENVNPTFANGWMRPKAFKSFGNLFSDLSIGHLAYSGSLFLWDLKKDMQLIILTQRLKNNQKFIENLRPQLCNLIIKELS